VKKVTTSAGNIRFDAERTNDGHADRFWSLALAVHAGGTAAAKPVYGHVDPEETKRAGAELMRSGQRGESAEAQSGRMWGRGLPQQMMRRSMLNSIGS